MPDQEAIANQLNLLRVYRRNLAHYLEQKAIHGAAFVPPHVIHGISEARDNIKQIKETLREWDVNVEYEPNDADPSPRSKIHTSVSHIASRKVDKNSVFISSPQIYTTETDADKLKEGFKGLMSSLFMVIIWIIALIATIYINTFLSTNVMVILRIFLAFFILFITRNVIDLIGNNAAMV